MRRTAVVVVALLACAGLAPPAAAAGGPAPPGLAPPGLAPGAAPPAAGSAPVGWHTVTLVTGDVVTVRPRPTGCPLVSVVPAVRGRVVSRRCGPDGHVRVVPADAAPLIGTVLDPDLFDVTTLIANGYDDARSPDTPLIVRYADGAPGTARARTAFGAGLLGQRPLPSLNGVAGRQPKRAAGAVRAALPALRATARGANPVHRVWLDRRVRVATDAAPATPPPATPPRATPPGTAPALAGGPVAARLRQVEAPRAWQAGYTGRGVRVAVLDTGVDESHPDLAGRVAESADFTGDGGVTDQHGHGTHVAATIAASGAGSHGRHRGVAPEAQVVVGKVLGADGTGSESQAIAGMEWAATRAPVVNMSLGGWQPSDGTDPLSTALDTLTEQHGTLFVVSAGNVGPDDGTVSAPGAAAAALTVGAVDDRDTIADFSSRGPLPNTDAVKPEIVAPGVDVVAARAAGTAMGRPIDARYTAVSGTSMAAPHVAGAAAILKQRHPDWRADRIKAGLIGAADPTRGGDAHTVGAGRLDAAEALDGLVADRPVVNLGTFGYPQSGVHEAKLAWTNHGDRPVDLTLSVALADRSGAAAPAGAVVLASTTVRAEAGRGAATVLRVDRSRFAGRPGIHTGVVTARTGDREIRTVVSFRVEPRTHALTLRTTALPDTPADAFAGYALVVNLDDPRLFAATEPLTAGADVTIRVPEGRYSVLGEVHDRTAGAPRTALAGDPDLDVRGDTVAVLDAAAAKPVTATVDGVATEHRAVAVFAVQSGARQPPWWVGIFGWADLDGPPMLYATPMPGAGVGTFAAYEYFSLDAPGPGASPYLYDLMRPLGNGVPADPAYRVDAAEHARLARLDQRFNRLDKPASPNPGTTPTQHKRYGVSPEGALAGENFTPEVPTNRTDFVTGGIEWLDEAFYSDLVDYPAVTQEPLRRYQPGSRQAKEWIRQPLRPDWYDESAPSVSFCQPEPIRRTAGNLRVTLVELADAHGRFDCLAGDPAWESAVRKSLTLHRDGRQIGGVTGSFANFTVPRAPGTYRLTYDLDASALLPVSTRVTTAWTFRSAGPAGAASVPVPLFSVDYSLPLDTANRPAGDQAAFTVVRTPGVASQRIRSFTVSTSTDDGRTWTPATVTRAGADRFTARMPAAPPGGAVSLRVHAAGDRGSAIEQTILRAYRAG